MNKAPSQTVLLSSLNPATNASSFMLTAVVSATAAPLSGSIVFLDGATQIATVPLDKQGSAVLPLSNLPIGAHFLTATYSGDSNFLGSQSATVKEAVVDSHSSVTLTSSNNPQIVTESVTLFATVAPALGGKVTTGSVTFMDGAHVLGTVPVADSTANLMINKLPVGLHSIVAAYQAASAAGPFDGISAPFQQTIKAATPGIIVGGAEEDFSLVIADTKGESTPGQQFSSALVLTPLQGLAGAVTTSCTGTPEGSNCQIDADTGAFDGANPITAKLTVTTSAGSQNAALSPYRLQFEHRWIIVVLGVLSVMLVSCATGKRRSMFAFAALLLLCGCGGTAFKTQPIAAATPPGTYTITVQSQSGSLVHTGQVILKVK